MNADDWPLVRLKRLEVEVCPRWSGLRDVTPIFARQPYSDWCLIFQDICEDAGDLQWHGAGFVRCSPDQLDYVEERLEELTIEANDRFLIFLTHASMNHPDDVRDLVAMEGSLAVSEGGEGYLCI